MTRTCPDCGGEYDRLGQHWYWNPDHREKLSEFQLGAAEYLVLLGGQVRDNTSHPHLEIRSTNESLLRDISNELGFLAGEPTCRESAEQVASDFAARFPTIEVAESDCSDVYELQTTPHPQLNYAGPTDVDTLRRATRRLLLRYHSRFVGGVLGSLHIDTGGMNVGGGKVRDLLMATGFTAYVGGGEQSRESFTHRPANDSSVVVVPHYAAIDLLEASDLSLSDIPASVQGRSPKQ
jgi:hypothetical protein